MSKRYDTNSTKPFPMRFPNLSEMNLSLTTDIRGPAMKLIVLWNNLIFL